MKIASFTPLSKPLVFHRQNHSVFQCDGMVGLSMGMCFEPSDVVELGLLCSPNCAFSEHSVSPM